MKKKAYISNFEFNLSGIINTDVIGDLFLDSWVTFLHGALIGASITQEEDSEVAIEEVDIIELVYKKRKGQGFYSIRLRTTLGIGDEFINLMEPFIAELIIIVADEFKKSFVDTLSKMSNQSYEIIEDIEDIDDEDDDCF